MFQSFTLTMLIAVLAHFVYLMCVYMDYLASLCRSSCINRSSEFCVSISNLMNVMKIFIVRYVSLEKIVIVFTPEFLCHLLPGT